MLAALCIITVGLVLRLVPLGLPYFVVKYGGSALWGAMVYALAAACAPSAGIRVVLLVAFAISTVTELSRLYHTPALDAFRMTFAGALLLGRIFSIWNIAAYCAGILLASLADRAFRSAKAQVQMKRGSPLPP